MTLNHDLSKTHISKLQLLYPYQIHKEIILNENLIIIDTMLNKGVISQILTTPPSNPSIGEKYIIPSNAKDEWKDKDGEIAIRLIDRWYYIKPEEGMIMWIIDKRKQVVFYDRMWHLLK